MVATTAMAVIPPEMLRSRESLPWQKVPAFVPKAPACRTPPAPAMIGTPLVVPIAPVFVRFPCVWVVGVRASERRESLPWQNVPEFMPKVCEWFPSATVVEVVPVGMRAMASVPLVMSVAACVCEEEAFPARSVVRFVTADCAMPVAGA